MRNVEKYIHINIYMIYTHKYIHKFPEIYDLIIKSDLFSLLFE